MNKYTMIVFIGLIIASSSFITNAGMNNQNAESSWRTNANNNYNQNTSNIGYSQSQQTATPSETSNFIIFNSNTIVLLLLLVTLAYMANILTVKRRLRFKGDVSKEKIEEYFTAMSEYFSDFDKKIIKEREENYLNLKNNVQSFIDELKRIAEQNKTTASGEISKLDGLMRDVKSQLEQKMTSTSQEISQQLDNTTEVISDATTQATNDLSRANEQLLKSLKTINGIHKYIDEDARNKDEKIKEYESSYNTKIVTKLFADSLITILDGINYELQKEKNQNNKVLLEIENDLLTVLSENNIKRMELKEGMLFTGEGKKQFSKVKIFPAETTQKSNHNKIANIKTHGYYKPCDRVNNGKQTVRPAQISVYQFKESVLDDVNSETPDVTAAEANALDDANSETPSKSQENIDIKDDEPLQNNDKN